MIVKYKIDENIKEEVSLLLKQERNLIAEERLTMVSILVNGMLKKNIINIINYSLLKIQTKIFKIAKDTLDKFSSNINNHPDYYANATLASLILKYEPVFIKANKNKLEKIDISTIKYSFIYRYEDEVDLYLACKTNTCFSFGKDFTKIKKDIENLL
jgi:hypothetical protein